MARKHFPGFPQLKPGWIHTDRYGDLQLVAVNVTSDGFLIGTAKTRSGEFVSNLFLGRHHA